MASSKISMLMHYINFIVITYNASVSPSNWYPLQSTATQWSTSESANSFSASEKAFLGWDYFLLQWKNLGQWRLFTSSSKCWTTWIFDMWMMLISLKIVDNAPNRSFNRPSQTICNSLSMGSCKKVLCKLYI